MTKLSRKSIRALDWKVKELVSRFDGELSRVEIQLLLDLKDAEYVRQQYILPALELGLIEMTLPSKPSSKLQKYRLTTEGERLRGQ